MSVLLRLEKLSCERDGRLLFDGLHLTVSGGECLELRGPNGSGKSTLLRAILGLFPDVTGTIEASECLYLGHRLGLNGLLTAEENLCWYRALQPGGGDVAEALARVGMAGYERVPCQHMSAGQQRRVALARLLVGAAPLWLLDEPFTALDAQGQGLVRALIAEQLDREAAVICATHQALGLSRARVLELGEPARAGGRRAGSGSEDERALAGSGPS